MFKKLYEEISAIRDKIDALYAAVQETYKTHYEDLQSICTAMQRVPNIKSLEKTVESQQKIVESQQRTIEQLTNALKDKYEHGLFIVSEDGELPMVIRNGVELTNQYVREFTISWCHGGVPYINIEQLAGTYQDMEV